MEHSKYSPSSAERWLGKCPGSVVFNTDEYSQYEYSLDYASEGTAAHRLAECCWEFGDDPEEWVGKDWQGIPVTSEMAAAVRVYLDTVREYSRDGELPVQFETRILHAVFPEDFGGTVDCLIDRESDHPIILDFKYGAGIDVDPTENLQLGCYAVLNTHDLGKSVGNPNYKFVVVQPRRGNPVQVWDCPAEWLNGLYPQIARAIMAKSEDRSPGSHCQFCRGLLAGCPEVVELSSGAINEPDQDFTGFTSEQLAEFYEQSKALAFFMKAIQFEVRRRLEQGESVPGQKLVQVIGNREYHRSEEQIIRACYKLGFKKGDVTTPPKLLSPAKLEKIVGREPVAKWVHRVRKGLTVAPESDKRPAVCRPTAESDFSEVEIDDREFADDEF